MNKEIMKACGLEKFVERVQAGLCPFCEKPVDIATFKDLISLREFEISGLCQECQDGTFVEPKECDGNCEGCNCGEQNA